MYIKNIIVIGSLFSMVACHAGNISTPANGSSSDPGSVDPGSVASNGSGGATPEPVQDPSSSAMSTVDLCVPNPCGVGGCTSDGSVVTCACPDGYSPSEGTCVANSSTPPAPNACTPTNPCGVGACTANGASYTCACPGTHNFNGTTCVPMTPPPDPCAGNPCGAGTCTPSNGSYTCACPDGFTANAGTCKVACSLGTKAAPSVFCPPAAWPAAWTAIENEVLALVNQHRAAGAVCGANGSYAPTAALTRHANLDIAARAHALDMAIRVYFDPLHRTMGDQPGTWTWSSFERTIVSGYSVLGSTRTGRGEAAAAGYGTAKAVVDAWMASPTHCDILMTVSAAHAGIGYGYNVNPAQPLVPHRYMVLDTGCDTSVRPCNLGSH